MKMKLPFFRRVKHAFQSWFYRQKWHEMLFAFFGQERIPETRWVYVEITNVCNLECKFCAYPKVSKAAAPRIISLDDFKARISMATAAGIRHIGLTPTVGDVFVDQHIFEKLAYLESNNEVSSYRVTTNLILPNRQQVSDLISLKKLDILGVSVYGHTAELFKQIAGGNKNGWNRLLSNLQGLLEVDELRQRISVGLRTVVDYSGVETDLSDMSQMLRQLDEKHPSVTVDCNKWYDNWAGLVSQADVEGINIVIPEEKEIKKNGPCSLIFHKNLITSDGEVLACACRDIKGELTLGNCTTASLQSILSTENSKFRFLIERQRRNEFDDVCKSCTAYKSIYAQSQQGVPLKEWLSTH